MIVDNGVGMRSEQKDRLFQIHSRDRSGVGIYNTDRRLKQLFGNGLHIESEINKGTTISFIIPNNES